MRVYEAKLVYEATLFEVANLSLNKPELVYDYMKDVLEVHPMQEAFYVILLNRKNRPLGRKLWQGVRDACAGLGQRSQPHAGSA